MYSARLEWQTGQFICCHGCNYKQLGFYLGCRDLKLRVYPVQSTDSYILGNYVYDYCHYYYVLVIIAFKDTKSAIFWSHSYRFVRAYASFLPSRDVLWGSQPQCSETWYPWWRPPSPPVGGAESARRPRPGWRPSSDCVDRDWPRCWRRERRARQHFKVSYRRWVKQVLSLKRLLTLDISAFCKILHSLC